MGPGSLSDRLKSCTPVVYRLQSWHNQQTTTVEGRNIGINTIDKRGQQKRQSHAGTEPEVLPLYLINLKQQITKWIT